MTFMRSIGLAATCIGLASALSGPAVMPTRRKDFEHGYNMNTGKRYKDKTAFRLRLDQVCRAQAPGAEHVV